MSRRLFGAEVRQAFYYHLPSKMQDAGFRMQGHP